MSADRHKKAPQWRGFFIHIYPNTRAVTIETNAAGQDNVEKKGN